MNITEYALERILDTDPPLAVQAGSYGSLQLPKVTQNRHQGRNRITQWPDLPGNQPQRRGLSASNGGRNGESARSER
jgi:hypothetical protein